MIYERVIKNLMVVAANGVVNSDIGIINGKFAAITATNHAPLYGLYPRKVTIAVGADTIAVGADTDVTLWDPSITKPVRQSDSHHGSDHTPWECFKITGWPVHTILRGAAIMKDGQPIGLPIGQHLERGVANVQ